MLSREHPAASPQGLAWPHPCSPGCPAQPRGRPGVMGTWWVLPQLPWEVGLRTVGQRGPSVPKATQVTWAAREGVGATLSRVCPDTAQGLLLPLASSLLWAPSLQDTQPSTWHQHGHSVQTLLQAGARHFQLLKELQTQINRSVQLARKPKGQTVTPTSAPGQFGAVNWGRNLIFRGLGN